MQLPDLVTQIFRLFADAGHTVYLVGGTVRDVVRGAPLDPDYDFATPTPPEETERVLRGAGHKPYAPGRRFGTVCVRIEGVTVEITTYRCHEAYQEGSRHPKVEFGHSIEEDLARRDFTMNAIAMGADGVVVDPFDGMAAIREGRIVVPGDIETALRDDPLRLLRLARFIAKLGFTPTRRLASMATEMAFLITSVSRERWKRELDKLLVGEHVGAGLEFLLRAHLLTFMMPELTTMHGMGQGSKLHHKDVWEHTKQTLSQSPPLVNIRWALLFHDCGKPYTKSESDGEVHFYHHEIVSSILANSIMSRLRFSKEQRSIVSRLVTQHMRPNSYVPSWSDSAVRRLRRDLGPLWDDMLQMARADITSRRPNVVRRCVSRLDQLAERAATLEEVEARSRILPKGLGTAIMEEWNLSAGPDIGAALKYLRDAIDEGDLEPGQEIAYYVEALQADYPALARTRGVA